MRIKSITVKNAPPIKNFQVDNLSDLVVIAGANGAGKTRLIQNILQYLQGSASSSISCIIEASHNSTYGNKRSVRCSS